jgi:hypothetical protein
MPAPQRRIESSEAAPRSSGLGTLARIYWMLAGNAALGLVAALIATSSSALSWLDLAYWAIVSSLVAVRYADVTVLGGTTADGAPATRAHWRRYAAALSIACAAVWAAAHAAALFNAG